MFIDNNGAKLDSLGNQYVVATDPSGNILDPRQAGIVRVNDPAAMTDLTYAAPALLPNGAIPTLEQIYAQWGKMWNVTTDLYTPAGTTEAGMMLIVNPSGSGKILKIKKFYFSTLGGNNQTSYKFYIDPTITANGTALTAVGRRQIGQATLLSGVYLNPTISAFGTKKLAMHRYATAGTEIQADYDFGLWIEPAHSLLITLTASVSGSPAPEITMSFAEE